MRWIKFFAAFASTAALLFLLSSPIGSITFPLGQFFSPSAGFWQNAEPTAQQASENLALPGLRGTVEVIYDERGVPHIFADNDYDLAMAQGFLTAKDRLWQMEFQTHFAAGRLTELVGRGADDRVLNLDREKRRKGLVFAAENAEKMLLADARTRETAEAYRDGVNAFIHSLTPATYPLEYKLLNYAPEDWTTLKTVLLLKYMANNLAGDADDIEYSQILAKWGLNTFAQLFPARSQREDPIIPYKGSTLKWMAEFGYAVQPLPQVPANYKPDSLMASATANYPLEKQERSLGSNNWAVSGKRTVTGKPMLANDPHLGLNFPSIWYEIQLHSPTVNAYGASLPGAPGVISGFNDSIAWGVTNAGRDVMDFFRVKYKDNSRNEYWFDGKWVKTTKRVEKFALKSGGSYIDTVVYTHLGPVMFDEGWGEEKHPLAVKWMAHQPSNEALTFILLNRAQNYDQYVKAIAHFQCPAQNFVFAAASGDIAIWQQGKFANKWAGQGKFVMDAANPTHDWASYIPQAHNPHILNPERGWVSSANQYPTDAFYPYYYNGSYEDFRNRRLNDLLGRDPSVSVEDMMAFQQDVYGYHAADVLPTLLREIDSVSSNANYKTAYNALKRWDYRYDKNAIAPTIFQATWDTLYTLIWKDDYAAATLPAQYPSKVTTEQLLRDSSNFRFYDLLSTPGVRENRHDLVNIAFRAALSKLEAWKSTPEQWIWYTYKKTSVQHLVPTLKPFHRTLLPIGGYKNILNASAERWGPSWRMVVSLGSKPEAYGIYPGGQSGNPGSPAYDKFINDWAAGNYYRLWFMQRPDDASSPISKRVVLSR